MPVKSKTSTTIDNTNSEKIKMLRNKLKSKMTNFKYDRSNQLIKNQKQTDDEQLLKTAVSSKSGVLPSVSRAQQKKIRQVQSQIRESGININQAKKMISSLSEQDKQRYMAMASNSGQSLDATIQQLKTMMGSNSAAPASLNESSDNNKLSSIMFKSEDQVNDATEKDIQDATTKGLPIMERTEILL